MTRDSKKIKKLLIYAIEMKETMNKLITKKIKIYILGNSLTKSHSYHIYNSYKQILKPLKPLKPIA